MYGLLNSKPELAYIQVRNLTLANTHIRSNSTSDAL